MQRLIDAIAEMHTYARPHGSRTERAFIRRYVANLPGAWNDANGNWIVDVGADNRVVWSCHTDTVHVRGGRQRVTIMRDETGTHTLALDPRETRRHCLGADDTAGVWLCRELIRAGVPGRYIFHYGEEVGCLGSRALATYDPHMLAGVAFAIALDRAGAGDVVTHQIGGRTASDAFATSIAGALAAVAPSLTYAPAHGVFTDTAEYADLVPECTNLSVGYAAQHSPDETLDLNHLVTLRNALIEMDQSALVSARVPGVSDRTAPVALWPDTWDDLEWEDRRGKLLDADDDRQMYLDRAWTDIQEAIRKGGGKL